MGIAERRERDRQEMRRLILEKATDLFLRDGFENVSIRKIAEQIEYSPATVYLYFKDKDEILYALHTEGFERLYALQKEVLSIADPVERLREHGRRYVSFGLKFPEYYELMFIMSSLGKVIEEKDEWSVGFRSYDRLRQDVKACMDARRIPQTDPEAATFALWSLVHGMVSLIIRKRCVMIPEEQLDNVVEAALGFAMETLQGGT